MKNMQENARYLASKLEGTGKFKIINKRVIFPLVAVELQNCEFNAFHLSEQLRQKGWIVPAYTLPPNANEIAVLRMVVKESFSKDMVEMLFYDIMKSIEKLNQSSEERKEIIDKKENPTLLY
jgi:glutamate decarboxylase